MCNAVRVKTSFHQTQWIVHSKNPGVGAAVGGNTEYGRGSGRGRQIVWIRKCYRFLNKEGSVYPASVRTAGVSLALSVPLTQ